MLKRVPFHPRKHRLDVIGALLMMAAAVALLLALSWGGRWFDWISPQFGALLLASAILWGLFAWRLVATDEPFLPLAVLGNPVVRCAALAGACAMATLVGMTIFVPLYFEVVLHLSASQSGMALIPLMGATVALSTVTGRLLMHMTHYKRLPLAGLLLAILSLAVLAIWPASMPTALVLVLLHADRLGSRHAVPDFHRVHAERGDAAPDGRRHRRGQFLPLAVLRAGGGGAGRDRARRASAASPACRWKCWRARLRRMNSASRSASCSWPARWCSPSAWRS